MTRGMADDTTDTTPGDAPDVLRTGDDGSLPDGIGARRAWVWMQDTSDGGGRFDVLATRTDVWRRKGATVVPNYPVHIGPSGRTAKPAANLDGRSAAIDSATLADQPAGREVQPADERLADQPDGERPIDSATLADQPADQADGDPAAADTTTTTTTRTKGGRTR